MSTKAFAAWDTTRVQRRTIHLDAVTMHHLTLAAQEAMVPLSEIARRAVKAGVELPELPPDTDGHRDHAIFARLPIPLDTHMMSLARKHHVSAGEMCRRLIAAYVAPDVTMRAPARGVVHE
jgi:hypothetical protein